jgi:hypothetical protein
LQALGAVGLAVGLFVVLPWGLALAIVSALAVAGGTVLEIGARPRQVPVPAPVDRHVAALDDMRRTASER